MKNCPQDLNFVVKKCEAAFSSANADGKAASRFFTKRFRSREQKEF